jgi:hypothetical protein
MGVKASEVGDWLRQRAGKRDHLEVLSSDHVVIRPGPNFHLLNPAPAQPPSAPEHGRPSEDRRQQGERDRSHLRQRLKRTGTGLWQAPRADGALPVLRSIRAR